MDKVLACLVILALVLLNALFVAAEFAIVSVPRSAMESRAQKGDEFAALDRDIQPVEGLVSPEAAADVVQPQLRDLLNGH